MPRAPVLRWPRERDLVREALVEDAGERVLIRAAVRRRTLDLFRSEVVERAHELAPLSRAASGGVLAEAEVAEIGVPAAVDQDVPGLDVTMNETAGVGGVEGGRDLAQNGDGDVRLEAAAPPKQAAQILSLDEAHDEVQQPAFLAGCVHGEEVRMLEGGGEP